MNYWASVTDFFQSKKWGMNMLMGAVCVLIPMIGPIIIVGWAVTQLWSRGDDEDPSEYPPFDFQFFTKYLMRGIWSFLAQMVAGIVMIPVFMVLFFASVMIVIPLMEFNEAISTLLMILGFFVYFAAILLVNFIIIPVSISATITQDFMPAFNFGFIRNFLSLVWKEMLIAALFYFALSIVMVLITVCTCYIGFFAVFPVFTFGMQHIQKQLYLLHLSRGGMILTRSQKLSDLPPKLPQIG